ncbi:MAG TPA: isoprenylcysteine carboxylmethyltransferase family protein [Thermoanaerobaculia bacterium]|nr:isoprenylcysteine carboxylmethyltransferase family protein [Thermoanaerobaculia bacterium]
MTTRAFAILRAAFVAPLFVSIWMWFFPRWFAQAKGVAFEAQPNAPAIALMVLGGLIMLRCVWDFAWTGRGTPAPFDPPRRLVVRGLYCRVRNPMYLGMGLALGGEAWLIPAIAREILIMMLILWAVVNGFVMLYEEPKLRELFGDDYKTYCEHVRRWIPRLTPWYPPPTWSDLRGRLQPG